MKRKGHAGGLFAAFVVLALLAGLGWWVMRPEPAPLEPEADALPQEAPAPVAASAPVEPAIRHPLPEAAAEPAAGPGLEALLAERFGARAFGELFLSDRLVSRIVATTDNLPREEAPRQMFPLRAVEGSFRVTRTADGVQMAPDNAQRYAPYLALLDALAPEDAARIYIAHYAAFQAAYVQLGYPGRYFNDRLVACLDNLLATPEPAGPLALVQPRVFYGFADPALASASAGQKLLLRMGPDNAARVKRWLREFRQQVTRR